MVNKVAFVTGSRADYGIMRRFLSLMNQDSEIELDILVTGALLSDTYGHQVELIYKDGFNVKAEIEVPLDSSSNVKILHTMAVTLDKFAEFFDKNRYDLLIILGDRYEMLSVAEAAAMQRIPILHIHGGEATFGNYDEFIRHAITKMSLFHFAATEEYRNRIIQLGESPERVFNLGALGAENCLFIDEANVPEDVKQLPSKKYFVVLFHPETLTNIDVAEQMKNLLDSITEFIGEYKFVFLGTNADTNSGIIRKMVKGFVQNNENAIYYENLHTDAYHYLVKNSICLIGNSSSGIIEAPSLGVYTINIGDRQKGRVRGSSVIDVGCNEQEISSAINKLREIHATIKPENPYYKGNSAEEYYETIKKLLKRVSIEKNKVKEFYDMA
ncbi:MAG: UDP-N-acetylglucosamine 2-epimerase (hydrolyzing) [Treponema sp.]|nr:UDP-N-acetylglucosamine 2-epimerase (hydrolyzing) [Treponema sp.]